MKLAGRISIVTGAAQGIGAAIAREFAREDAVVAALDRKEEVGKVCDEIGQAGGKASAYVLDITDQEAYRSCVEQVASKFERIDVLVNNAAISRIGDILNDGLEQWREMQKVNLEAVYWGCKLVAPYMVRQRHGRIITIASVQAIATDGGAGSYVAAKGALVSFTKSLAVELAPHRVLANAIAPGFIHTSMSIVNGVDETETELFKEWYVGRRKVPLGARASRKKWLASPCSSPRMIPHM
jgi:3-oxoacyl-[acyl-carrier protein] reductase